MAEEEEMRAWFQEGRAQTRTSERRRRGVGDEGSNSGMDHGVVNVSWRAGVGGAEVSSGVAAG